MSERVSEGNKEQGNVRLTLNGVEKDRGVRKYRRFKHIYI